jgi:hypothetical protein
MLGGEACAADEGAVDIVEGEQLGGIVGPSPSRRRGCGCAAGIPPKRPARERGWLRASRDVAGRRGAAGADRPDRLVGDDELGLPASSRDEPASWEETRSNAMPSCARGLGLADADDRLEPARSAASALARRARRSPLVRAPLGMAEDDEAGAASSAIGAET